MPTSIVLPKNGTLIAHLNSGEEPPSDVYAPLSMQRYSRFAKWRNSWRSFQIFNLIQRKLKFWRRNDWSRRTALKELVLNFYPFKTPLRKASDFSVRQSVFQLRFSLMTATIACAQP